MKVSTATGVSWRSLLSRVLNKKHYHWWSGTSSNKIWWLVRCFFLRQNITQGERFNTNSSRKSNITRSLFFHLLLMSLEKTITFCHLLLILLRSLSENDVGERLHQHTFGNAFFSILLWKNTNTQRR